MTAVVAARDEAPTIAHVVKSLIGLNAVSEVVVIADGSTDDTAAAARAAGARVLSNPVGRGKGHAVDAAVDRSPADVYLLVDGDVGETADAMGSLLRPVLAGELDLAIGRLPELAGGGFGVVKGMARWWIRRLSGFVAHEPLSGQRAVRGEALRACRPLAAGFGLETAMTIDAARLGFRVGEIPVNMRHRPTGRSIAGFAHRGRQGLDILLAVIPRAIRVR